MVQLRSWSGTYHQCSSLYGSNLGKEMEEKSMVLTIKPRTRRPLQPPWSWRIEDALSKGERPCGCTSGHDGGQGISSQIQRQLPLERGSIDGSSSNPFFLLFQKMPFSMFIPFFSYSPPFKILLTSYLHWLCRYTIALKWRSQVITVINIITFGD